MAKIVRSLSNSLPKGPFETRRAVRSKTGIERAERSGTIKDWPMDERPRERLLEKGPASMTDSQLLAILLRTGRARTTAVELALELLGRSEGVGGLSRLSTRELCAIPGMGPAKAAQLLAALEIGRRSAGGLLRKGIKVRGSADVFRHYQPVFRDLKKEVFNAILLDTKHRVIKDLMISTGTVNMSLVHPREVFGPAVNESATAVIVAHNHPSGDPAPSPEDLELTRRLVRAGEIMGIPLLDHLIIGDGRYVSLSEQGLISGGLHGSNLLHS